MAAPLSYAEAEAHLQRRIKALDGAFHLYQCTDAKTSEELAVNDARAYLQAGEDDVTGVLVLITALYFVVVAVSTWLVWRLLRSAAHHVHFRLQTQVAHRALRNRDADIKAEIERRILCTAPQRAVNQRIYYWATVKFTMAAVLLLGLGSLQALTSALVRGVLWAWWDHLTRHRNSSDGENGSPFLPAVVQAATGLWRCAATVAATTTGTRSPHNVVERADESSTAVAPASSLWSLLRSAQNLYLWSYVGSVLLTLAVYLLASAARGVRAVLADSLKRSDAPLLDRLDREATEGRRALQIHESVAAALRRYGDEAARACAAQRVRVSGPAAGETTALLTDGCGGGATEITSGGESPRAIAEDGERTTARTGERVKLADALDHQIDPVAGTPARVHSPAAEVYDAYKATKSSSYTAPSTDDDSATH